MAPHLGYIMEAKVILKATEVARIIDKLSSELLLSHASSIDSLILLGIGTEGCLVAQSIQSRLALNGACEVPVHALETCGTEDAPPRCQLVPPIPDVNGKICVIVDVVLSTGRTACSALSAVFDAGRPAAVRLAVLVSRSHRTFPVNADYVGKNLPTACTERILVQFGGNGEPCAILLSKSAAV